MTDEMIALARRAVACKGWRWMPGMKYIHRHDIGPDVWSPRIGRHGEKPVRAKTRKDVLPMFHDPATLGCLLALVREAWNDPAYLWGGHAEVRRDSETLFVVLRFGHDANGFLVERWVASGATEAEALVAALEDAP